MVKLHSLRKKSVAVCAGLVIAGAVGASAASLGGLSGVDLGADTDNVGACDTDGIDVEYRKTFNASQGQYVVDRITLTDIDLACAGSPYSLSIYEKGAGGLRAWIDSPLLWFSYTYDRDPGPGVDVVAGKRYNANFPADVLQGIAIVINSDEITL